eukprot:6339362-Lingulodinium_polyedra.AAC.1
MGREHGSSNTCLFKLTTMHANNASNPINANIAKHQLETLKSLKAVGWQVVILHQISRSFTRTGLFD